MSDLQNIAIVSFKTDNRYNIFTEFSDGKKTKTNFKKELQKGTVFESLKDINIFEKKIKLINGTIGWDLYEGDPYKIIDVAPEFFYYEGKY
jgi:hypothetical protein